MGVFTVDDTLRAAAIEAGYELGLFAALSSPDGTSLSGGEGLSLCATPLSIGQLAERLSLRATHRLAALVDALVALGILVRDEARVSLASMPARGAMPLARTGWGAIADVIRADQPLALDDGDVARRYQRHLISASAPAARELAARLARDLGADPIAAPLSAGRTDGNYDRATKGSGPFTEVVDIGGGAGAYTRALLELSAGRTTGNCDRAEMGTGHISVTLVDAPAVVALAREELADFGAHVRFVEGDARTIDFGLSGMSGLHTCTSATTEPSSDSSKLTPVRTSDGYDIALLANVLHLHSPAACADLCAVAVRSLAPGGVVAIVDLRRGTLEGEMFALNMAVYTDGGSVYSAEQIGAWLRAAGVDAIEERGLESAPEMIVVLGRRGVE